MKLWTVHQYLFILRYRDQKQNEWNYKLWIVHWFSRGDQIFMWSELQMANPYCGFTKYKLAQNEIVDSPLIFMYVELQFVLQLTIVEWSKTKWVQLEIVDSGFSSWDQIFMWSERRIDCCRQSLYSWIVNDSIIWS